MPDTTYPNWFEQTAKKNFEIYLAAFAEEPDLNFLQIGAFTGDATVWLCNNILRDLTSELIDIDTWQGSNEEAHESMDFDDVHKVYLEKTDGLNRGWYKGTSLSFFMGGDNIEPTYDFIYIDGDHTAVGVLLDAEMSWALLKPNGIIAFDDYTWGTDLPPELSPTLGIDLFLARHEGEYETLVVNEQYWIRKK